MGVMGPQGRVRGGECGGGQNLGEAAEAVMAAGMAEAAARTGGRKEGRREDGRKGGREEGDPNLTLTPNLTRRAVTCFVRRPEG